MSLLCRFIERRGERVVLLIRPPCLLSAAAVPILVKRASEVSVLGDFLTPLLALFQLASIKQIAKALTCLPFWLPAVQVGSWSQGHG